VPLSPGLRSPFCAKNGKTALAWDENIRMEVRGIFIGENVD
jgi:hypothetical protein